METVRFPEISKVTLTKKEKIRKTKKIAPGYGRSLYAAPGTSTQKA